MAQNGNATSNDNLTETPMSEEVMDAIREHAAALAIAIQNRGIGKIQFVVGLSEGTKGSEWQMTMERVSKYMVQ